MNTLLYRVIKINTVTGERRYTGGCVTVKGRKFSKKTDAAADAECYSCRIDQNSGHAMRYEVERVDQAALKFLAELMRDAANLLDEIERNSRGKND